MNSVQRLQGVIPVMITPMLKNGQPDPLGIESVVELLVASGAGGIWLLGSAGEDINMSVAHRKEVVRLTAEANNGRIPIITGTGLTSFDDNLDFFRSIADLDLAGIHILPYDVKMGESTIVRLFTKLADEAPHPLWIYHNPKRGKVVSDNTISILKDHPNIRGIKFGGYDLTGLTAALMHKSDSFEVIGAGGGQFYQMLSLGAEAHTASDACVIPEPFIELYKAFKEGDVERARDIQFSLIRLFRKFPRTDNGEHAAEEKAILSMRGVCEKFVNPVYKQLDDNQLVQLSKSLAEFGFDWAKT